MTIKKKTLQEVTAELRETIMIQTEMTEGYNDCRTALMNDGLDDQSRRTLQDELDAFKSEIRSAGESIGRLRRLKEDLQKAEDRKKFLSYRK